MKTFTQISGIVKSGFNRKKGKFNKNKAGGTSDEKFSRKSSQKFKPKNKKGPNPQCYYSIVLVTQAYSEVYVTS